MTTRPEIQLLLREGIAAVRRGDRVAGREKLLQVVEADERNEAAWLWLAGVVDDPHDQLIALENALALNPQQTQVQARVAQLRAQLGVTDPVPEPEPEPPTPFGLAEPPTGAGVALKAEAPSAPAAPVRGQPAAAFDLEAHWFAAAAKIEQERPSMLPRERSHLAAQAAQAPKPPASMRDQIAKLDPADDPFQCAYCGRPTAPEDTRCPHCKKNLMANRGSGFRGLQQWGLLLLSGIALQANILMAGLAYLKDFPVMANFLQRLEWLTGFGLSILIVPLWVAAAGFVLWSLLLWLAYHDLDETYPVGFGVGLLEIGGSWLAFQQGVLGPEMAWWHGLLGGALLVICGQALVERFFAQRRLRVVPDKALASAAAYYTAGQHYARRQMWALAALHFQHAVSRSARDAGFYKELGRAQLQLRRYPQALQSFTSGAELAPNDAEFAKLKAEAERGAMQ